MSEALVASAPALAPFDSVTGFQVVALDAARGGGFVTFEGAYINCLPGILAYAAGPSTETQVSGG